MNRMNRVRLGNVMESWGNSIEVAAASLWGRLYNSRLFWCFIVIEILAIGFWGLSLISAQVGNSALYSVGTYERLWVPQEELYRFSSCGIFTVDSSELGVSYTAEEEEEIPLESDCLDHYFTAEVVLAKGYWTFTSPLVVGDFATNSNVLKFKRTERLESNAQISVLPQRRLLRLMVFLLWALPVILAVRGVIWIIDRTS